MNEKELRALIAELEGKGTAITATEQISLDEARRQLVALTTIKVVSPDEEYFEGTIIKIVENVKSLFNGKLQTLLVVKVEGKLRKLYIAQSFWDALKEQENCPERLDKTMFTVEMRVIGRTTYFNKTTQQNEVFGKDAPAEAHGTIVETIVGVDNVDDVEHNATKASKGATKGILSFSDDELARLGKAGIRVI